MSLLQHLTCCIPGPGGRSLVEIQQMSGANIQISKKGTFAPGTRNRIVTITGTPTAISNAQYLIEQKIQVRACLIMSLYGDLLVVLARPKNIKARHGFFKRKRRLSDHGGANQKPDISGAALVVRHFYNNTCCFLQR